MIESKDGGLAAFSTEKKPVSGEVLAGFPVNRLYVVENQQPDL